MLYLLFVFLINALVFADDSDYTAPVDFFNLDSNSTGPEVLFNLEFDHSNENLSLHNASYAFASPPEFEDSYDGHACDNIGTVPAHLTHITRYRYYRKYTQAYNIPIVSSANVQDAALKRACYVVRFLFADRPVLRQYMRKHFGRVGIVGINEGVTQIPEHSFLGSWWNQRARGLGGTLRVPISTGGEENLLCWRNRDRYPREDIFLHELCHGLQEIAIRGGGIPGYYERLTRAYNNAKRRGLWRNTYAMSTVQEYFAEGVQSFFEVNDYSPTANGVHNNINTREKLRNYDRILYELIREVFPCENKIHDRCTGGDPPEFRMNCDGSGPVKTSSAPVTKPSLKTTPTAIRSSTKKPGDCTDKNSLCPAWAKTGHCTSNPKYMRPNCRKSCGICDAKPCFDRNGYCESWANYGYCKGYHARYMSINCKESCGLCG